MDTKQEFNNCIPGSNKKMIIIPSDDCDHLSNHQDNQKVINIMEEEQIVDQQKGDRQQFYKLVCIMSKPKRPLSSYFFFVKMYTADFGEKHTLTELGEIWKNMSQDYKEKYVSLNVQDKERYQKEMQQWLQCQDENKDITLVEHEMDVQIHFPISRIKMILKEDESCKLIVRKEAYFYIQKAAELFGQHMLNQCKQNAQINKRKRITEDDLYASIKGNEELLFLNCLIQNQPQNDQKKQQKEKIVSQKQPIIENKQNLLKYFNKK